MYPRAATNAVICYYTCYWSGSRLEIKSVKICITYHEVTCIMRIFVRLKGNKETQQLKVMPRL